MSFDLSRSGLVSDLACFPVLSSSKSDSLSVSFVEEAKLSGCLSSIETCAI